MVTVSSWGFRPFSAIELGPMAWFFLFCFVFQSVFIVYVVCVYVRMCARCSVYVCVVYIYVCVHGIVCIVCCMYVYMI